MEEPFEIGQLTKELVAMKLKKMADPCAAAAELVKQTLTVALAAVKTDAEARSKAIADACKGGMTGLLLADQNLPRGAALTLEAVVELAGRHDLDPGESMRSALRGMAELRRYLREDQLDEIGREIGLHFMGAGEVFAEMLAKPETPAAQAEAGSAPDKAADSSSTS